MSLFNLYKKTFIGIVILLSLSGCSSTLSNKLSDLFCLELKHKSNECINRKFNVRMNTNKGKILLQINGKIAPVTSSNFLFLVQNGLYEGTTFNRVVTNPFPFVVQGGYKTSKYNLNRDEFDPNQRSFLSKEKVSLNYIPLEIKLKGEDQPRYNQIIIKSDDFNKIELTHHKGALVMARSQALNSASIQFYISLKKSPELDGRYAVFGKVLEGIDIVESIEEGDVILSTELDML